MTDNVVVLRTPQQIAESEYRAIQDNIKSGILKFLDALKAKVEADEVVGIAGLAFNADGETTEEFLNVLPEITTQHIIGSLEIMKISVTQDFIENHVVVTSE